MLEIFDGFGNVRSDLDTLAPEIEQLDDVKREKLFAALTAKAAKRDAEANLASARKDVREKEAAYHQAMVTHAKFYPPVTHQQALRDVINSQSGRAKQSAAPDLKALAKRVADLEKKSKDKPELMPALGEARNALAIAQLPAKLQEANNALAVAQADVAKASRALKDAECANNEAIAAWVAANADMRPTHESLVREAAMRDAERALAAKAAEPAGPHVWPLEQNLMARGAQKSRRVYFGR